MKSIKYILFLLLIAIIGISIYIAVQPNTYEVTRSRTVKAPAAVIYENVIDFKNWKEWSSWIAEDPDIRVELGDKTAGEGAVYRWNDDGDVGTLTNVSTDKPNTIQQKMQYNDYPPSDVIWTFEPNGDGTTDITRTISGKNLPFMFKAYLTFTGGMEKEIAPHFENELEKIDSIVVNGMMEYDINIEGITEYGGGFYMYKTTSSTSSNISNMMAKQYASILNFINDNAIKMNGMPFTIYNEMNADGSVIMSNAIPVPNKVTVAEDSNILCGYMERTRVLKTTLQGDYINLAEAWKKAFQYAQVNQLEISDQKPFEVYTNDPGDVPNPANYTTELYIPLKSEPVESEQQ